MCSGVFSAVLLGCTVEAIAVFFYLKKSKPCQDLSSAVVSLPSWRPAPLTRLSQMKEGPSTALRMRGEAWRQSCPCVVGWLQLWKLSGEEQLE